MVANRNQPAEMHDRLKRPNVEPDLPASKRPASEDGALAELAAGLGNAGLVRRLSREPAARFAAIPPVLPDEPRAGVACGPAAETVSRTHPSEERERAAAVTVPDAFRSRPVGEAAEPAPRHTFPPERPQSAAGPPTSLAGRSAARQEPGARPAPAPPPRSAPAGPALQRFPGSGLLDGIKKRIAGVVDGVRSGWSSLSSGVQSAVGAVQGRVRAAMDGLGGLASSFVSGLQSAWGTVRSTAGKLADAAKQKLGGALAGVMRAAGAIKSALMNMDPGALQAAWQALKGVLGGAGQVVGAIGGAVGNQLKSLWAGLQSKASSGLQALQGKAGQLIGGIRSLASGVVDRVSSGWDALSRRADGLSSIAGGALRAIRSVVERLVSGGRQVWDGIKRQASGLKDRAASAVEGAGNRLSGAWDTIKRRASGAFDGIKTAWNAVRTKATDTVGKLTGGVTGAIGKLKGFSIGGLIDKLTSWVPAIKKIKAAADDPDEAIRPMLDGIVGKLKAETPAKSQEVIGEKIAEASGGGAAKGRAGANPRGRAAPAPGPALARTPARGSVQVARYVEERSTAGWSEIGSGVWEAVKEKFAGVEVGKLVKDILWSLIWPWPGVIAEFKGMWGDWKKAAGTLFAPRNPLSDPLGCLHDLYSDLLKLIDFPMILWRRLNNIGMLLMGWVTIALVILGAVGGSVAGGVIGGIIGALAGLGVGAAPGGGAGAAAGGLTGAGAGFTAALAIGEALVISTVAAEGITIVKALLELKTGRQTKEEKVDDYNQAANSALMLAIIGVLFAIGWIGSRIATAAARLFRKVFPKEKPPVQPPKTDPGKTQPPKEPEPPKAPSRRRACHPMSSPAVRRSRTRARSRSSTTSTRRWSATTRRLTGSRASTMRSMRWPSARAATSRPRCSRSGRRPTRRRRIRSARAPRSCPSCAARRRA